MPAYLDMDEAEAAAFAARRAWSDPDTGALTMHAYRDEWREAGEAAYRMIDSRNTAPQIERIIALAIARHARLTGQCDRAIGTLTPWANVEWDGDEAVLHGQLDLGQAVVGLAQVMADCGQQRRATTLLRAYLVDSGELMTRYGRGAVWLNDARALAFASLERPDEAMAALQDQARLGFEKQLWRVKLEDQPAFDGLRSRQDYRDLLAAVRAHAAQEREQLRRMRAEGLVPERR